MKHCGVSVSHTHTSNIAVGDNWPSYFHIYKFGIVITTHIRTEYVLIKVTMEQENKSRANANDSTLHSIVT